MVRLLTRWWLKLCRRSIRWADSYKVREVREVDHLKLDRLREYSLMPELVAWLNLQHNNLHSLMESRSPDRSRDELAAEARAYSELMAFLELDE